MSLGNDDCPYGVNDCPKIVGIREKLNDMAEKQDLMSHQVSDIRRIIKDCGYIITIAVAVLCAIIGARVV